MCKAVDVVIFTTHGTCDIEARDINNSCNATPVPVLHTSHGVNTSPFDDTGDKNYRISGSSSLLMIYYQRMGDRFLALPLLESMLQSMSPRAFMRKQAKAHVDTPTCARQLMYSSTHGTCDIEARDINNSSTFNVLQSFYANKAKAPWSIPQPVAKQLMYSTTDTVDL
ncbi:hypothetical protein Tco_1282041 [Tanacetum coccineum]